MDIFIKRIGLLLSVFSFALIIIYSVSVDIKASYIETQTGVYDFSRELGEGEITDISCRLTSYSGYGRHRKGELIDSPDLMDIELRTKGSIAVVNISGLLDYEDWEVSLYCTYKKEEESENRIVFAVAKVTGTTPKDNSVSDGYELTEKLKKYKTVVLKNSVTIPKETGSVIADGKTSGFKSEEDSFEENIINGKGYCVDSDDTAFIIKNRMIFNEVGIKANKDGISVEKSGALEYKKGSIEAGECCIKNRSNTLLKAEDMILKGSIGLENNGDGFKKTVDRVVKVSGNRDMTPVVDTGLVETGISKAQLTDVSIVATNGIGVKNAGEITFLGTADISGETAFMNMGVVDLQTSSLCMTGQNTAIDNGSWIGIVTGVLKEKDSSYTKDDLISLGGKLFDDLSVYAPSCFTVTVGGSGPSKITGKSRAIINCGGLVIDNPSSVISGNKTCVENAGSMQLNGGIISGGQYGIYNKGSVTHKAGIVTGNSDIGVYQDGYYYMAKDARVDNSNVIHLEKDRIITVVGELRAERAGCISLDSDDMQPGRKIVDVSKTFPGRGGIADRLAGSGKNGEISEDGQFVPAFKYVFGHKAAFRSGKGTDENGEVGTVVLSALYCAKYKNGLGSPSDKISFEVPEDSLYFWREKQKFHTGCDISQGSRIKVFFENKNITPTFIQKGWESDGKLYHEKDMEFIFEEDKTFEGVWDMAAALHFRGNEDTDEVGNLTFGAKDYYKVPVSLGYVIPQNAGPGKERDYFIKVKKQDEKGQSYMQRFSFKGWSTDVDLDEDGKIYAPGDILKDMSIVFDALKDKRASFIKCDSDGYRAGIDLLALWDAHPVIKAEPVYIYDRELSDPAKLESKLLSKEVLRAFDREDGVLSGSSIKVLTDPKDQVFDKKALCDLGNYGKGSIYYEASDSAGNRSIFKSEVFVVTSDDEDKSIFGKVKDKTQRTNPSGTSPRSEDAASLYVRYIGEKDMDSFEPASKWYLSENNKLLKRSFSSPAVESYVYDHKQIKEIKSLIMETAGLYENNNKINELLGYERDRGDEEIRKLKLYSRSGTESAEIGWERVGRADTAIVECKGSDSKKQRLSASLGRAVFTGLKADQNYEITVSLKEKNSVIAKGKISVSPLSIDVPSLRLGVSGKKNTGEVRLYYSLPKKGETVEIQRRSVTARAEWEDIAKIAFEEAVLSGLRKNCMSTEALYKDIVTTGVYEYRLRTRGTTLGDGKEKSICYSSYSEPQEIGFCPAPKINGIKPGIASYKLNWSKVRGADGYLLYYHEKGRYDKVIKISKEDDFAVVANNIKENEKYSISLKACVEGKKRYISSSQKETKIKTLSLGLPRPRISMTSDKITIDFDKCENADYYTIERIKLPHFDHGKEIKDITGTKISFERDKGVYEYSVTSVGSRLDGTLISKNTHIGVIK
ncbi:MAG: hypothetical protein K6F00_06020 [Lachnospiraceae bacterium]|nr:hypothetical protein [Lachnospiraceae bacterium]